MEWRDQVENRKTPALTFCDSRCREGQSLDMFPNASYDHMILFLPNPPAYAAPEERDRTPSSEPTPFWANSLHPAPS